MAFTLFEGAKLSRNPLARGVLLAIATSDEMIAKLRMEPKPGESYRYDREKALPTAEWVAPNHSSLTESSGTVDQVVVPIRLMVSDVDVYNFVEEQMGDTNSQRAIQTTMKLKAAGRSIADKAVNGAFSTGVTFSEAASNPAAALANPIMGPGQDSSRHGPGSIRYTHTGTFWAYRAPGDRDYGAAVAVAANTTGVLLKSDNPSKWIIVDITVLSATADGECLVRNTSSTNEPDGLKKLCPTSQTILSAGATGDDLTFEVMDQMIDELVKVRNDLAFVCNGKLKRKFYALQRALGGTNPEHISLAGLSGQVPTYRGIPIVQNDNIKSDESKGGATTLSSLYLADFSEEGFGMGVGSVGEANIAEADPRNVRVLGLRMRQIGELEDKEAQRTRLSFYGAFHLKSELGVARASQLKTA